MAGGQFSLTRRACPEQSRRTLLGAACAVPAAVSHSRHPRLDPGSICLSSEAAKRRWAPDQVRRDGQGEGRVQLFVVTNWDRALKKYRRAEAALAAAAHCRTKTSTTAWAPATTEPSPASSPPPPHRRRPRHPERWLAKARRSDATRPGIRADRSSVAATNRTPSRQHSLHGGRQLSPRPA